MIAAVASSSPGDLRRAPSSFPYVSNVATGATSGPTFTDDVIDGMLAITAAASRVAWSTAAETYRSFECPAANPLNEAAA